MDRHCKTKNEKKTILIWILKPKSFNVQDYTIPNMFELGIVIIVKLVLVYSIITSIIKFMFITSSKLTKKNKKLTTTKNQFYYGMSLNHKKI
jgi:hypothetical protein